MSLDTFTFEGVNIQAFGTPDKPWFYAKDVAKALGHNDDIIKQIDPNSKMMLEDIVKYIDDSKMNQEDVIIISFKTNRINSVCCYRIRTNSIS